LGPEETAGITAAAHPEVTSRPEDPAVAGRSSIVLLGHANVKDALSHRPVPGSAGLPA
jgi:hypothetical protein